MKAIDEGHGYELDNFERCPHSGGSQSLWFVKMDEDGTYHDGTTNEEVLAMLINRMRYLEDKFPCCDNRYCLESLSQALRCLEARTAKRVEQGVEGKHEAHTD